MFVVWVFHNIPNSTDITWIKQGGGLVGGGHPPAKKFNAGQKVIFWAVIIGGGLLSVSASTCSSRARPAACSPCSSGTSSTASCRCC